MPLGNTPSQNENLDPLPPGLVTIAADIVDKATLIASRGFYRDQIPEDDSLREKLKAEIKDDLRYILHELFIFSDYQYELAESVLKAVEQIKQDILAIDRYLDDDWPEYPYESLVRDTKSLYDNLEN